ncbi:MFS transporter [Nocardioides daejeonensis]|uniref:MFS transporter n=1 Tax=Nocardioides daejeonensis TaxID=1046556 RepID=UPI0019500A02|nr:MFS transporter [Nocardioides daejeonensis]
MLHPSNRRRWAMLGASTLAQGAAAVSIHGAAFLIPALRADGLSLTEASTVAAAPTLGVMLMLVPWGLITDRYGERLALLAGLTSTAAAGCVAMAVHHPVTLAVALFAAGACAASTAAASGRVVVGWFPPERRGLAMGIRQTAQPLGVGVAAISLAVVAERYGVTRALGVPVLAAALAATVVALVVTDPPRPPRTAATSANPYRRDDYLLRIHAVSVLLVVPQFLVWTFALVWLVEDRHWSAAAAGGLVAAMQLAGAAGRITAGHLSDRVGSRMRPLRWITVVAAGVMVALGATAALDWPVAVLLLVLATVITVADNGLAFTAVAERAGAYWSGRALGIQNTSQYLAASAVPPVAAWAITQTSYATAFALAALFPALAVALVPLAGERANPADDSPQPR